MKALTASSPSDDVSVEDYDRTLHQLLVDLYELTSLTLTPPQREGTSTVEWDQLAIDTIMRVLLEADRNKVLMAR